MVTYREVGATRTGPLPAGYRHLRTRIRLGRGDGVFDRAAEAVLTWRMHRAAGVTVRTGAPRAVPGAAVTCGLGIGPLRLWAPCEVVWAAETGFGYGTLPGHPMRGEEAFVVDRDADGDVWFTVTAFSTPARRLVGVAGPFVVPLQHLYARRCGRALRRLAAG